MRLAFACVLMLVGLGGCGRQTVIAAIPVDPCADAPAGAISVQNAWARPAAAGGTSALYALICNKTNAPNALVAVSTAAASAVELHTSERTADGTVTMNQIQRLDVLAGAAAALAPGGAHVMLIGLAEPLAQGATEDVVFQFQSGPEVHVSAIVTSDAASGHAH